MEALELASWPQMEKGRQSVMSTFEPRFGGALFWSHICVKRRLRPLNQTGHFFRALRLLSEATKTQMPT